MARLFLAFFLVTLWTGVAFAAEAPAPKPLKLTIAVNDVYGKLSSCACTNRVYAREYDDFLRLLRERYSIELELHYYMDSFELEKDCQKGRFDGALGKPWQLMRHQAGQRRAWIRVADLQDPDGGTKLWGMVLVLKASPLKTLKDLAGKRLAQGQADTFETHQAVFTLLKQHGLDMPQSQRVENASNIESLDLLLKGDVDAAVVSSYTLVADCAVDFTTPEQFRILAETERIPLTSLMIDSARVSSQDIQRLQEALFGLTKTALPESMCGGGFVKPDPWSLADAAH